MTPVYLLTGFLGAGKTTLLNRLVAGRRDTALVVNEFGAIAIDHHLVRQGRETPIVTSTGCLCCARGSDLRGSLADLLHARQQGEIADFSRVIVETTGMADPAPIINSLIPGGLPAVALRDHTVARSFRLAGVITVVDASLPPERLQSQPEILRQIVFADHLVLSHTDRAPAGAWPERLRQINPGARLHDAASRDFDPQALLDGGAYAPEGRPETRPETVAAWLAAEAAQDGAAGPDAGQAGGHRHKGIASLVLTDGPARPALVWQDWLHRLASQPGILRIKGVLAQPGAPGPLLAQAVGHRAYPLRPLDRWPAGLLPQTWLVVIGSDLDAAALRQGFLAGFPDAPAG